MSDPTQARALPEAPMTETTKSLSERREDDLEAMEKARWLRRLDLMQEAAAERDRASPPTKAGPMSGQPSIDRGEALFDQRAFARQVRVRAAELGLSGREAADQARVSRATYSRVTRCYCPDVETYLRLIAWLDATEGKAP